MPSAPLSTSLLCEVRQITPCAGPAAALPPLVPWQVRERMGFAEFLLGIGNGSGQKGPEQLLGSRALVAELGVVVPAVPVPRDHHRLLSPLPAPLWRTWLSHPERDRCGRDGGPSSHRHGEVARLQGEGDRWHGGFPAPDNPHLLIFPHC